MNVTLIKESDFFVDAEDAADDDRQWEYDTVSVLCLARWSNRSYTAHVTDNSIGSLFESLDQEADPFTVEAVWCVPINDQYPSETWADSDNKPNFLKEELNKLFNHYFMARHKAWQKKAIK